MIDIIYGLKPTAKLPPHILNDGRDLGVHDNQIGKHLLIKWRDQNGYASFEETVGRNRAGEE
jgi:hypothetical protein